MPDFGGLKISQDEKLKHRPTWNIRRVRIVRGQDRLLLSEFGVLGWGGNSGFHALNLAVQFGAKRIVLVGFDMRVDMGVHWHGSHPPGMNNPTEMNMRKWRAVLNNAAPVLATLGITVVNASPVSALTAYPIMTLEDALA